MMEPAGTVSPPNAFTPRRFELESRPFRDEPPPFLCAIRSPGYQSVLRPVLRSLFGCISRFGGLGRRFHGRFRRRLGLRLGLGPGGALGRRAELHVLDLEHREDLTVPTPL